MIQLNLFLEANLPWIHLMVLFQVGMGQSAPTGTWFAMQTIAMVDPYQPPFKILQVYFEWAEAIIESKRDGSLQAESRVINS